MKGGDWAVKSAIGLAIGALCLYLAASQVETEELGRAFATFNPLWLIPAVAISLAIQLMRAWRWQLELRPLARLSFGMVWLVVATAYMFINLLPFRLGEPTRPLLMSWKSGLEVPAIVANWALEKTMDLAALVFFVHLTLLLADLPQWAARASVVSLAAFSTMALVVVGFWRGGEAFFSKTLGRLLPPAANHRVLTVLRSARSGLAIIPQPRLLAMVFAQTLVLWALPILSSYVLILGFGLDLPVVAALAVFVAVGAGTALPNPPAMIGVFQIAAVVALGLFGVPKPVALAYGIVLNAVQFITLVAQGLVALAFVGVGPGRLTRQALSGGT